MITYFCYKRCAVPWNSMRIIDGILITQPASLNGVVNWIKFIDKQPMKAGQGLKSSLARKD